MRIGEKITKYRFIGGQANGTPDDHIINCRPHGFYMIIFCPNSHHKLTKPKKIGKVGIIKLKHVVYNLQFIKSRLAPMRRYLNIFVAPIRMKS